jgi:hypothetical protein
MSTKNWIRTAVVAGLVTWPGVETYRLIVAQEQLAAAQQRQSQVTVKLAQVKNAQFAKQRKGDAVTPVSSPAAAQPKNPSNL